MDEKNNDKYISNATKQRSILQRDINMSGFNFEKNIKHPTDTVNRTIAVFENLKIEQATGLESQYINPEILHKKPFGQFYDNLEKLLKDNNIDEKIKSGSNIIDIMMEIGTGKTYTYAKTIFELNKNYGIFKFIVVVPTLSSKAGTIDFLKSESTVQHFIGQYEKRLHLHSVESRKGKNKKSYMPLSVCDFVCSGFYDKNKIQVLIINEKMLNSETMQKSFDNFLFDKYSIPFEAISSVKPFLIIDAPHRFSTAKMTLRNIQKINPQFILRYGTSLLIKK